jgi:hypothetical protein
MIKAPPHLRLSPSKEGERKEEGMALSWGAPPPPEPNPKNAGEYQVVLKGLFQRGLKMIHKKTPGFVEE